MSEWKEIRLGDLCYKVCSGGTPKSTCSTYYEGGKIPWLNTKEINYNRIYSTESHITEEGLNNSSAKWIDANSVIVAMYGATAGRVAIAKVPMTTNQACCNLMIDTSKADYNYIYYYLSNSYKQLLSMANGAAQQNLNAQVLKDFVISLPNLQEQRYISSILSSLDDKIAVNKKICENLEAQAQALFQHWFVDFAPFKDGEFVESELGMIPKGWRVGKLDQVTCNITDGVHNTVKDVANGGFYLLSCKNIKGGIITIGDHERTIDGETFNKLRKRTKLQKGDILLSSVGTIGEMVLLNDDLSNIEFQRSVAIIKPDNDVITSHFLFYSLMNQKVNIIHSAHGAVQQCLFISDIANFSTIIPPKEDIIKFTNVVKVLVDKKTTIEKENNRLASLRDTLLPKLMSGQIKV